MRIQYAGLLLVCTLSVFLLALQTQDCSYEACERKFGPGQCTDYIRLEKLGARTPTGEKGLAKCWPVDDKIVRAGSVAVFDVSDFGHVAWVESVTADGFEVSQWNNAKVISNDPWERCCAKSPLYHVRTTSPWKLSDQRIRGFYHPELHPVAVHGTCAAAEAMQRSHVGAMLPPASPITPPPLQHPQSTVPFAAQPPTPRPAPANTPRYTVPATPARPAPYLGNAAPNTRRIGTITVDLYGSNFVPGARVHVAGGNWSSDAPPVRFLDQSHLQTVLVISAPGTVSITVMNPDGQRSGSQTLQITR